MPRQLRQDLESFCEGHVIKIIQKLEPRIILAEGIGTYRSLKDLLRTQGISLDESHGILHKVNRRVVYARTENSRLMLLGILHLSGARPSKEELKTIRNFLSVDLSRQLIPKVKRVNFGKINPLLKSFLHNLHARGRSSPSSSGGYYSLECDCPRAAQTLIKGPLFPLGTPTLLHPHPGRFLL